MRVAIYIPYIPDGNTTPALGPLYLLSVLEKNGFEGKLFDARIDKEALNKLIFFKPHVVGASVVTAAYPGGLLAAKRIKEIFSDVAIIFGGPHPTSLPKEVIAEEAVDYVIIGEGEKNFLELCNLIRKGDNSTNSLRKIKNLVFKDGRNISVTEKNQFLSDEELEDLPFPAFHLMDLDTYFASSQTHGLLRRGKRILPIISTRGCPNSCTFCCRVMGNKIRSRSIDSFMYEARFLVDRYNIDELYIEDDNFTSGRERALEILEKLAEFRPSLYLKFANGIRADLVDKEILKAMKKANVYSLSFGIESGCRKTLYKMKKNLNLDKAKENIIFAKSLNFFVGSNCIIGYPDETVDDIEESLNFFFGLPLDSMAIVNLVPFPGTEVRDISEKKGYLTKEAKNWGNYYFSINNPIPLIETPMLSKDDLVTFVRRAYRRMYLRPKWIFRMLKYFSISQIISGAMIIFRFKNHRKNFI